MRTVGYSGREGASGTSLPCRPLLLFMPGPRPTGRPGSSVISVVRRRLTGREMALLTAVVVVVDVLGFAVFPYHRLWAQLAVPAVAMLVALAVVEIAYRRWWEFKD